MAQSFSEELDDLRKQSLLRKLQVFATDPDGMQRMEGKEILSFSSNDYLGLARSSLLKEAATTAIAQFGVGSGASRLVSGTLRPHVALEQKLASFKSSEAALSFSSGYMAAVGALSGLCRKNDVIILDKLCHASLIDGARLSGAVLRVFPHNHWKKLESHLAWTQKHHPEARVIVVTESVFSMDGDLSPLREIVALKQEYGALLLLDEAHAIGVIGKNGQGLAAEAGLEKSVDIQMGTLSKALGCSGGYLCGSQEMMDLLINRARSFIYSTAPSPANASAAAAALDFLESEEGELRRQKLWDNIRHFDETLNALTGAKRESASPIIPVILGASERAIAASQDLLAKGFYVPAIRYPTVAKDSARLRLTISASHEFSQIEQICRHLATIVNQTR